jgi:hypothetical protein
MVVEGDTRKIVIVMTEVSLQERLDCDFSHMSRDVFAKCVGALKGNELFALLKKLFSTGRENRLIYLGDDGVLAYVFGDRVLDLYGSRTRLRCRRCGHRWWITESDTCPMCGSRDFEHDYVRIGERPRERRLLEAIYEATSADIVVFDSLHDPPENIELLLLLVARRFTKVYLSGNRPSIIPAGVVEERRLEEVLKDRVFVQGGGC